MLGFEVSRADDGGGDGYVAVAVDYAGFAKAFGGDFASRLRLVRARACRADVSCAVSRVAGRNDLAGRRLRAMTLAVRPQTPSGPAPDSGFGPQVGEGESSLLDAVSTTYVMSASASGAAGDYSASSVSPADRWNVGLGSGAFTYSYPVVVFRNGNDYIVQDVDGHLPDGLWKRAGSYEGLLSKNTRWGTYDYDLNRIGP